MAHSFLKFSLVSLLALGGLTACEHRAEPGQNPFVPVITKDLQDYSHDAADDLISESRYRVGANTPVLVGTLNDVDKLERSSTFGRLVTEQISARFVQRGFTVSELKMRNSVNIKQGLGNPNESGEYLLSRDVGSIGGEHKAAAVITGSYAVAGKDIFVNLKMIDVATGKLISGVDYNVPLDSNVRELVDNDATSFYGTSMAY